LSQIRKGGEEMKYISFMEYCLEDTDKILEKEKPYMEETKKFPEKYPKTLFPEHGMSGEAKAFEVIEATPEQLINEAIFWMPEVKFKFVPIFESSKVTEAYLKSK
jgi:hypothetical protein